jgi:hypothetical protein
VKGDDSTSERFARSGLNGGSWRDILAGVQRQQALPRRAFLALAGAFLAPAQGTEPVIDIHQHTNSSSRTDEQLIAHQRAMGIAKSVLLPAGSAGGLAAGAGGNDTVVEISRRFPDEYKFFANELPDIPETKLDLLPFGWPEARRGGVRNERTNDERPDAGPSIRAAESEQAARFCSRIGDHLSLAIGANTSLFTIVNAVLLRPLSYADPDRLVLVWERNMQTSRQSIGASYPDFEEWRQEIQSFRQIAAARGQDFTLTRVEQPERLHGLCVSYDLLSALGVNPQLGRTFPTREQETNADVAMLADTRAAKRLKPKGDIATIFRRRKMPGVRCLAYRPIGRNRSLRRPCR